MTTTDRSYLSVLSFIFAHQVLCAEGINEGSVMTHYRQQAVCPGQRIRINTAEILRKLQQLGYVMLSGHQLTLTTAGRMHILSLMEAHAHAESTLV